MNLEVNQQKNQQMDEVERPETSKCSRQQNQLNKTLTNFRQKQGTGGAGDQQMIVQQQQILQSQTQKNQPLQPMQNNNGVISDRQQSRSGTRQGKNNNSFQTTGQGFFRETFYKENNNNNSSNIAKPIEEEGMTLDKFFGSNFQVINLGFNEVEEKPNKQNYSMLSSHSDSFQQNYNPKNNKHPNQEENKHQRSSNWPNKDKSLNGESNTKISSLNKNPVQIKSNPSQQGRGQQQNSQPDENSNEYKEYMEEEFEIHETDEEYSESYRESQADLNMTENLQNDETQKTSKLKRKSIEERARDKSFQQDYSLTGKGIKQYLTTQESGDENQIKIQKKLRDKYSKKMRHKSFNAASSNSHQNNSIESINQTEQSANSTSSKSSQNQQTQSQSKQNQNISIGSNHYSNYEQTSSNNGKGKFSTNNTTIQPNSINHLNFSNNTTVSGLNERGSSTCIDDSFEANAKNNQSNVNNNHKENNNNNNNNITNILNSTQKRQKSIHENQNQTNPFKQNANYQKKDKQISGNIKDFNLNNSYIHTKQSQQQSNLNHSLSLNQQSNEINSSNPVGDLQSQNSFQMEKSNKNYNIRKLNKSQSPPIHDPFQPLITHSRNFSREKTQIISNQNQNNTDNSQNNSIQDPMNQTNIQTNGNYSQIKNNTNNTGNGGINHSQILNSCSGDSFKQNYLQQNNSHVKVSNPTNNNSQHSNQNGAAQNNIQYLQRKSKYGEFLESQNDKVDNQKQFRASFYQLKQGQQQQSSVGHAMDAANFTQISQSFVNGVAGGIIPSNNANVNPILAPLNSLPTNNSYYNSTSKNRLTLNEFYKHQSKYEDYSQPNGPPQLNKYEEFIAENLMRRTAKENKFMNQKEKLNELIKKEDINFVTKYAARFNLNTAECQQLIQTGKQEKIQMKKRMETPQKGFRGEFQQNQQKKKLSVSKESKQLSTTSNHPISQINRPQYDNNQYQSKERNSVLF